MPDREKVIKGLEDSLTNLGCGYMDGVGELYAVSGENLQNAITMLKEQDELLRKLQKDKDKLCLEVSQWKHKYHDRPLKEQEAVEPIYIENPYTHLPVSYCPKCREPISKFITGNPYKETKYCHYCGQEVKWE